MAVPPRKGRDYRRPGLVRCNALTEQVVYTGWVPRPPVIAPAKRLQAAFDIFDREFKLKQRMLERKFPKASKREIDKKLYRWLGSKPALEGPEFVKVPRSKWPKEWRARPKPPKAGKRKG